VVVHDTTAEEAGLLGANIGEHPLYPLEKTLADINMTYQSLGKTHDLEDLTTAINLDDLLARPARGRPRDETEQRTGKGGFYRVDSFLNSQRPVSPCCMQPRH